MVSIRTRGVGLLGSDQKTMYESRSHDLSTCIGQYLEWKAISRKRAPGVYRIWLERFADLTRKSLEEVTVSDVARFKAWLEDGFAPKSCELAIIVLQNFFKFSILQGYRCLQPELIVPPRTQARSYPAITEEEYQKLLDGIAGDTFQDLRDRLIVRLLWETGIRVSELCDMTVTGIDAKRRRATIATKKLADSYRQIFWSTETQVILDRYLTERMGRPSGCSALFIRARGVAVKGLSARQVERVIRGYCLGAGIDKKITPHSFRHGKAHYILEQEGSTVKDVQGILGHKNPVSSFHYLQWNDKELEKRARRYIN